MRPSSYQDWRLFHQLSQIHFDLSLFVFQYISASVLSFLQGLNQEFDFYKCSNLCVVDWVVGLPVFVVGISERERQVMKKLKEVVDKQRDEIRAKDRELTLRSEDIEAVSLSDNRVASLRKLYLSHAESNYHIFFKITQ